MFGYGNKKQMEKSNKFKYEKEVTELINQATTGLNQRIAILEIQNQQLQLQNQIINHELNGVKLLLGENLEKLFVENKNLEKRITDFTDLWHPIMAENINRIKSELEQSIKQAERADINNIKKELTNNIIEVINNEKEKELYRELITELTGFSDKRSKWDGMSVKLSDIKNGFDKKLELLEKLYDSKMHKDSYGNLRDSNGVINFEESYTHFLISIDYYYKKGINIIDNDNNILVNGSNSSQLFLHDILKDKNWKKIVKELKFVDVGFNSSSYDKNYYKSKLDIPMSRPFNGLVNITSWYLKQEPLNEYLKVHPFPMYENYRIS